MCMCVSSYLNVSDEELCRRLDGRFGINDFLDGTCPVHSLIEMLGEQPVAVLPPIHCDAPVAWNTHNAVEFNIILTNEVELIKVKKEACSTGVFLTWDTPHI